MRHSKSYPNPLEALVAQCRVVFPESEWIFVPDNYCDSYAFRCLCHELRNEWLESRNRFPNALERALNQAARYVGRRTGSWRGICYAETLPDPTKMGFEGAELYQAIAAQGGIIRALKEYRDAKGCGLREAKDELDALLGKRPGS